MIFTDSAIRSRRGRRIRSKAPSPRSAFARRSPRVRDHARPDLPWPYKLIAAASARWRSVNAPHLVALVRAGAVFHKGKLLERPTDITPTDSPSDGGQRTGTEVAGKRHDPASIGDSFGGGGLIFQPWSSL